jgi:hypothetical protein
MNSLVLIGMLCKDAVPEYEVTDRSAVAFPEFGPAALALEERP